MSTPIGKNQDIQSLSMQYTDPNAVSTTTTTIEQPPPPKSAVDEHGASEASTVTPAKLPKPFGM